MSSTAAVRDALQSAHAARRAVVLAGESRDWYFLEDGIPFKLKQFVASVGSERGLTTVFYRRGMPPELVVPPGHKVDAEVQRALPSAFETVPDTIRILIELVEQPDRHVLVHIDGVENLLPEVSSPVTGEADLDTLDLIQRVATGSGYLTGSSLLVLSEHCGVLHHRVRRGPGFTVAEVPPPCADERRKFLVLLRTQAGQVAPPTWIDEMTVTTAGLTLEDIRATDAIARHQRRVLNPSLIADRKAQMIQESCEHLELLKPLYTLKDIAGIAYIKEYLDGFGKAGLAPRSLLLAGPPGVGKTFLARALGKEMHRPIVKLNMIDSPYVGENERQLRRSLQRIESLAPVIVFIDELDQKFQARTSGSGGDSGTTARVQSEFMEWSGDVAGRADILMIATTNRPDLLDSALRNRFQTVVPVLHPTTGDLLQLIPSLVEQLHLTADPDLDLSAVVLNPKLRAVSARQLSQRLEAAAVLAARTGSPAITTASLLAAVDLMPEGGQDIDDRFWSLLAMQHTHDESLLPWWSFEGRRVGADVPYYAQPVCAPDGRLDRSKLAAELDHVMRQRR